MRKLWDELQEHWFVATLLSIALGIGAIAAFLSSLAAIWTVMSRDTVPEFLEKRGWFGGAPMTNATPVVAIIVMLLSLAVLVLQVALWRAARSKAAMRPIPVGTFSKELVTTSGKKFDKETVVLDGRRFERCKFKNCRLEYHGTGNTDFVECAFEGEYLLISPDEPCHMLFNIITQLKLQSQGIQVLSRQNQNTGDMEHRVLEVIHALDVQKLVTELKKKEDKEGDA